MFDASSAPTLESVSLGNNFGAFREHIYRFGNVESLEQMYDMITSDQVSSTREGEVKFVTVSFNHLQGGGARFVALRTEHLDSFDDFQQRIDDQIAGEVVGSDALSPDEFELELSWVKVARFVLPTAYGGKHAMLYETKGVASRKGNCVAAAMAELGWAVPESMEDRVKSVPTLIKYIEDNQLPIRVIGNSVLIRKGKTLADIREQNGFELVEIPNKRCKTRMDKHKCCRLTEDDYRVPVFYEPEAYNATLVYDIDAQHVDILDGDAVLKPTVRISGSCELVMGKKIVLTSKQFRINADQEIKGTPWYLFFDYETVVDYDHASVMKPYSLSVMLIQRDTLAELDAADEADDTDKIAKIRLGSCKTFIGFDCGDQFLRWFQEIQSDKIIWFCGFNNSSFDNIILLDLLLRHDQRAHGTSFAVTNVFYNGSRLLNMTINGRHRFFDLHNHLVGSLASLCKSFKVKSCSKLSFDHNLMQQKYVDGTLEAFITDNQNLIDYNEMDNIACSVLFNRYRTALMAIPSTAPYAERLEEIVTIGSLSYKSFTDWTTKSYKPNCFGKLSFDQFKALQTNRVAGRVEVFHGPTRIPERVVSLDTTSLYPFVMCCADQCWYPMGTVISVEEYIPDRLGFWYCDFEQTGLKERDLPTIFPRKTEAGNDWSYDGPQFGVLLSNVTIDLLRKYGCTVTTHDGFVFEGHVRGCDLFKPLLDIMGKKNAQDVLKANGSPEYSPALRETYKLLSNSLSGKVGECIHTQRTEMFSSTSEYLMAVRKAKHVNHISNTGNKFFVTMELDERKLCSSHQRPIYLASLLYDYSRRHMFEYAYARVGLSRCLYSDTDCLKFRHAHLQEFMDKAKEENVIVPHWSDVELVDPNFKDHLIYVPGSKVYGALEDELEDCIGTDYMFYALGKKLWSYCWRVDGKWHSKTKLKGVNEKAFLLTTEEPFFTEVNGKLKVTASQKDLWAWSVANPTRSIKENNYELMERLWLCREARVLCSTFRKVVKNTRRNVSLEDTDRHATLSNVIQVLFSVKHLKITREEDLLVKFA